MKTYFVYIVSNKNRTTFYIGVTNDLERRAYEHANHQGSVFTQKYKLTDLLFYEESQDINEAIAREKQLKQWNRKWKIDLIKTLNPDMKKLELF